MANFLLDTAQTDNGMGSIGTIIFMVLAIVVMYFVIIRPQKKQEKEVQKMLDELAVGDMVTTIGGIIGEVVSMKDDTVLIETSGDRTRLRMLRSAVKCVNIESEEKSSAKQSK